MSIILCRGVSQGKVFEVRKPLRMLAVNLAWCSRTGEFEIYQVPTCGINTR